MAGRNDTGEAENRIQGTYKNRGHAQNQSKRFLIFMRLFLCAERCVYG